MRKKSTHDAGRPPSQRQLRVGEELRHTLAALFQRGDFHDPDLVDLNITVTEVRISPDLRNATVFVTPLGGGEMDEALTALRRAAPFLRGQIARAMKNLRHAPTLSFEGDTSFDYASHIDNILHSPAVARDLGHRVNGDDEDEDDGWDEDEDETGRTGEDDDSDEDEDDLDDDEDDDEDEGADRGGPRGA
jgi:ribosome-binding factor A